MTHGFYRIEFCCPASWEEPKYDAGKCRYREREQINTRIKNERHIQSAKDLEGKRLAVTIGSTGEIAAKRIPHAQVRVFNTLSDCFLELINNGVDAVLNDIPTNDYYAVTAGAGKVDSLSISLAAEDLGIAVKKGRKDLLEKINKGLASLKASGEFTAIYKKWFGREPSPELLR